MIVPPYFILSYLPNFPPLATGLLGATLIYHASLLNPNIQCPQILKLMVCLKPHFLGIVINVGPNPRMSIATVSVGVLLIHKKSSSIDQRLERYKIIQKKTQSCRAVHAMADLMVTCGKKEPTILRVPGL